MKTIEITDIQISIPKESSETLAGIARIVLMDCFVINGIRIIKGKFGLFVSWPREYNKKEGKGWNICFPITKEFHEYLSEKILAKYKESLDN